MLGPVYEQFERGHWREGFGDACTALETEARKYVLKGMDTGRIVLVNPDGSRARIGTIKVKKQTLGQLAHTFDQIQIQNHTDKVVGDALKSVNADRVGEAHLKGRAATEAKLRRNVGRHMWTVIEALKAMHK